MPYDENNGQWVQSYKTPTDKERVAIYDQMVARKKNIKERQLTFKQRIDKARLEVKKVEIDPSEVAVQTSLFDLLDDD